ncbi:glycosyltransferase family 4 protein [Nocardia salmonicida]|uniref:glycosyltransferase family 4 protein n=1 Tax=Nocardia salmonicida TaxID=53431 RepID=UPI0007A55650|nr:glycosyltransferase family 4 protein [Nocardia salmonicida]MBC7299450.1 glycosyltransferase family 4 protein [Nocardia sp.]
MHIAIVHRDLHSIGRGGICTLYRALAPLLRDAGHEVTLITQHTPHPLFETGIRIVTLPRTEELTAHRRAVSEALVALRPDVVESSSWEAETLEYLGLPAQDRAPVLIRGDLPAATMRAWPRLITTEHELLRVADIVVAVSEFAAADLAAAYGIARPRVIANGVDRKRFRAGPICPPTSGERITLGSEGRITTSRRLDDELTAPPPWTDPPGRRHRLVWVGKTTPMKGWDHLERLARELADCAHITVLLGHAPALTPITLTGTETNVTILRDLSDADLPSFYRAADYLLSTSRWEGFGLAIAEALACGTPVLLPADLGTAPELLAAGGGYTYRTGQDIRARLNQLAQPSGVLPAALEWGRSASQTLATYQTLHSHRTTQSKA